MLQIPGFRGTKSGSGPSGFRSFVSHRIPKCEDERYLEEWEPISAHLEGRA